MSKTLRTHKAASLDGESFWTAVGRASARKALLFSILFIRHLRALMPLLRAPRGSNLHQLVRCRPELFGIVLTPYIALNWDARTRITRIIDHFHTVEEIGGVLDFPHDIIIDLVQLSPIHPRYRITLDQPSWLLREGSLALSLWDGIDRIFHLTFCLSTEGGKRVAYIGAIQGRSEIDILDRYRRFTKLAAGMRPRDFLVEVFKMLCKAIDVTEIRAVSELNHPQRRIEKDVKLPYDQIWFERGGRRSITGFFILQVVSNRRAKEDIPAKKKAMYAKRYTMLNAVELELASALNSSIVSATDNEVENLKLNQNAPSRRRA